MTRTKHQSNSPDLQCPDRPWRSPGLLPANTPGFSPWLKRQGRECNLFRSVPRLWMLGAIPPLTYTSRWHVYSAHGQTYLSLCRWVRSDVALFVPKWQSDCASVKLTVGFGNNQLEALFHVFIYFMSLHVSIVTALIIRRSNCINTSSGMINLCKWLPGMPVRRDRHTRQSLTQTNHTRWRINTIRSPDDERCDDRNM